MSRIIAVTKKLSIEALLELTRPEFAQWYRHGVWWAMYGDFQGRGVYSDIYLIETTLNGINNGWYKDLNSGWFDMLGFKLGMLHGGYLVCPSPKLVTLTDPDFAKGYEVGRDFCFNEAPLENRVFSDQLYCEAVHEWAKDYASWSEPLPILSYCLGCRIGELSGALIPDLKPVPAS